MKHIVIRSGLVTIAALVMLAVLIVPLTQASPNATFTVTKTADTNDGTCNADCSLREAIAAANLVPGSTVIVPAGTYTLTLFGYNDDTNATGDLDIKVNTTISSATATKPIIVASAGFLDRVMQTMTDTSVILSNVTISNGTSNVGGGIYALGSLTLNNVNIYSNTASWGGGVYIDGHVLTIISGTWQRNSASIIGGALASQASAASISGTVFISNTADRGAGLANVNNISGTIFGMLLMTNVQVLSNTAPLTTGLGAGIYNDGYLILTNGLVNYNRSGGTAGGLYNSALTATVAITGSQFVSNTASNGGGGGIFNYSPMILTNTIIQSNTATGGGGINNNNGTVTMTGGLIAYNTATQSGGSGGGVRSSPYLKLVGVTVRNNYSAGSGGGVLASGQLILVDSFVTNNDAFQGGGLGTENATLDHTLVATNTATYGGGLSNGGTTTLLNGSAINNNIAFQGGGVYNGGMLIINNSSVISNATTPSCLGCSNGGGIYNANGLQLNSAIIASNKTDNGSGAGVFNAATGNLTALNSAIISNTSGLGSGGGISNTGSVSMTNVTLSGNTTNGDGGGLANGNSARLTYVTIANNIADNNSDGAGVGGGVANTGALTVTASIIGNNQVKTGLSADCFGPLNSGDYNVLETMALCTVTGATAHDYTSVDPALDLLANLSGTWVHAPFANSVAVNHGSPACPATDQRGVARPIGAACDIGAFESAFLTPQTITFNTVPDHLLGDAPFTVAPTASSGLSVTVTSLTSGVCTVSNNLVTLVATGTCTLRAAQGGNAVYAPAPDVDRSFTVKQAQTISFAALPDRFVGDPPFAITATATSGLVVSFSAGGECGVIGAQVTLTGLAGTCTITATQAGNVTYAPALDVARTFKILHPIFLPLVLR